MLNKAHHLPLHIAILLSLAACGGGGGSERAVSANPNLPERGSHLTGQDSSSQGAGLASTGTGSASSDLISAGRDDVAMNGESSASRPADTPAPAISAAGVNAAVLAAMLDTRTPDLSRLGGGGSPVAVPVESPDGPAIESAYGPFIGSSQQLEPSNYVPLPADAPFNPYVNDQYAPNRGGSRYHASNFIQNRWNLSGHAATPFTRMEMNVGLATTDTTLSLGEVLNLITGENSARQAMTLNATGAYSVQTSALVPYDQVIQQWNNGVSLVQLMLRRGREADEAQLCWNVQAPELVRLICNTWEVSEDWQPGQPLSLERHTIEDGRSVHPGEAGHLYWRG
ncbi:MAG: hypothetical protein Q4D91_14625 [Lautropia sp.]|nr:hypothetical protein [Lautropia sp.]